MFELLLMSSLVTVAEGNEDGHGRVVSDRYGGESFVLDVVAVVTIKAVVTTAW
jgi:hypothetical protein